MIVAAVALEGHRLAGRVVLHEQRRPALPGLDAFDEIVGPGLARRHVDQMLDVDGREHRLVGAVGRAVGAFDADAFAVLDDQALHHLVGQRDAAVILDQPHQDFGQHARAALGDAPAPALPAPRQRIGVPPGHRPFRRRHGLERHPQHEAARVIVLEIVADDLPGRLRLPAQPFLAVGMLVEPVVDRLAEADRRVGGGVEQRLDRVVFRRTCAGRRRRPSSRTWRTARWSARCRGTASANCRRGTARGRRSRDGCIPARSRQARVRRSASSGCLAG